MRYKDPLKKSLSSLVCVRLTTASGQPLQLTVKNLLSPCQSPALHHYSHRARQNERELEEFEFGFPVHYFTCGNRANYVYLAVHLLNQEQDFF
jgi:hypothetical protein